MKTKSLGETTLALALACIAGCANTAPSPNRIDGETHFLCSSSPSAVFGTRAECERHCADACTETASAVTETAGESDGSPGGTDARIDDGGTGGSDARAGYGTDGRTAQSEMPYTLRVEVFIGVDDKSRATIAWLGEPAMSTTTMVMRLSKDFATEAEARAFTGTFVVALDGAEVGRDTASYAACDKIADLGLDPQGLTSVVVRRSLDSGQLTGQTHSADLGTTGCYFSPDVPPSLSGPPRWKLHVHSTLPVAFSRTNTAIPPRDVQLDGTPEWTFIIPGAGNDPIDVSLSGAPAGSFEPSFVECASGTSASKQVVEEERWLAFVGDGGPPQIEVDPYSGYGCAFSDGTGSRAIP